MIPFKLHSGKGKTAETNNRSLVARIWMQGESNYTGA